MIACAPFGSLKNTVDPGAFWTTAPRSTMSKSFADIVCTGTVVLCDVRVSPFATSPRFSRRAPSEMSQSTLTPACTRSRSPTRVVDSMS